MHLPRANNLPARALLLLVLAAVGSTASPAAGPSHPHNLQHGIIHAQLLTTTPEQGQQLGRGSSGSNLAGHLGSPAPLTQGPTAHGKRQSNATDELPLTYSFSPPGFALVATPVTVTASCPKPVYNPEPQGWAVTIAKFNGFFFTDLDTSFYPGNETAYDPTTGQLTVQVPQTEYDPAAALYRFYCTAIFIDEQGNPTGSAVVYDTRGEYAWATPSLSVALNTVGRSSLALAQLTGTRPPAVTEGPVPTRPQAPTPAPRATQYWPTVPLPGIRVALTLSDAAGSGGAPIATSTGTTDSLGQFWWKDPLPAGAASGSYLITATALDLAWPLSASATTTASVDFSAMTLLLTNTKAHVREPVRVTAVILDPSGAPVPGVVVTFAVSGSALQGPKQEEYLQAKSGADGRASATVQGAQPGLLRVVAGAKNSAGVDVMSAVKEIRVVGGPEQQYKYHHYPEEYGPEYYTEHEHYPKREREHYPEHEQERYPAPRHHTPY